MAPRDLVDLQLSGRRPRPRHVRRCSLDELFAGVQRRRVFRRAAGRALAAAARSSTLVGDTRPRRRRRRACPSLTSATLWSRRWSSTSTPCDAARSPSHSSDDWRIVTDRVSTRRHCIRRLDARRRRRRGARRPHADLARGTRRAASGWVASRRRSSSRTADSASAANAWNPARSASGSVSRRSTAGRVRCSARLVVWGEFDGGEEPGCRPVAEDRARSR